MKESQFQNKLISKIRKRFPDAIILKNDANYIQGFPDLLVLWKSKWAALECKASKESAHQPNQDYYVAQAKEMSYAAFVYPENEEEVFNELQQAFRA